MKGIRLMISFNAKGIVITATNKMAYIIQGANEVYCFII